MTCIKFVTFYYWELNKLYFFITVGIAMHLKPVSWYGRLAMILAYPCIGLDAYRGAVSLSSSSLEVWLCFNNYIQ